MRKIDRAALELALHQTLAEKDQSRVEQVRSMLEGRTRLEVSQFCSFHRQIEALRLQPWELPPCLGDYDATPGGRDEQATAGRAGRRAVVRHRSATRAPFGAPVVRTPTRAARRAGELAAAAS